MVLCFSGSPGLVLCFLDSAGLVLCFLGSPGLVLCVGRKKKKGRKQKAAAYCFI